MKSTERKRLTPLRKKLAKDLTNLDKWLGFNNQAYAERLACEYDISLDDLSGVLARFDVDINLDLRIIIEQYLPIYLNEASNCSFRSFLSSKKGTKEDILIVSTEHVLHWDDINSAGILELLFSNKLAEQMSRDMYRNSYISNRHNDYQELLDKYCISINDLIAFINTNSNLLVSKINASDKSSNILEFVKEYIDSLNLRDSTGALFYYKHEYSPSITLGCIYEIIFAEGKQDAVNVIKHTSYNTDELIEIYRHTYYTE